MIDDLLDLKEDIDVPPPKLDLDDPQPWFLKFTEPIFVEEKKDENLMFPWPPGAPRPLVFKTDVTLQEVLDFICAPLKLSDNGNNWKQQVSDEPVNRTYEEFLKKCLEDSLNSVKSRFSGFCPYRNKIYRDMFSEVIRIVTVGMKERGLLLLRVKDDIDATVDRFNRLYKSSMGYGIRKQMRVEEKKLHLELKIDDMREETYVLRLMSKNFVTKSKAAVDDLRDRKQKLLEKKQYDLELLKRVTCVIEKTLFQVIYATTERQRKRFLKACLLFKDGTEDLDEVVTCLLPEEKTPTPSSSVLFVKESATFTRDSSNLSLPEVPESSRSSEEVQETQKKNDLQSFQLY